MSSPAFVAPEPEPQPAQTGYAAYGDAAETYGDEADYDPNAYEGEYDESAYAEGEYSDGASAPEEAAEPVIDGQGTAMTFKGRFQIFPDQPLPQFNTPHAYAFNVQLRTDPARPIMGLVCEPDLPQRTEALEALRGFNLPGMLKPLDWGLTDWPGEEGKRFVILLDRPGGARLMASLASTITPLIEDDIIRCLLQPLVQALKDLQIRGIAHRGVRPDNLFWTDPERKAIVLGDGWTVPPGYEQPPVFETIESMMCDPSGRGAGLPSHDLYSLGVTILTLLVGRNPVATMTDGDLLTSKIEFGSYATLVGQYRLPLGLMEVLRGLLSDDQKERWTVTDLDMWLSGRRLSPKQSKLPQRASRPFQFGTEEYFHARSLAIALSAEYKAAAPAIKSKAFDGWLRRAVGDEAMANAVQAAINSAASGKGPHTDDRMVARVCIALDPPSPIRYRGFGTTIEGLGPALLCALNHREQRQTVCEIISGRLAIHWVASQTRPGGDDLRAVQVLEKLPAIMDNPVTGFGVERVIYELNQGHRCLSPLFEGLIVTELEHVLPALELAARAPNRPDSPLDRHLAAFIAARMRRGNDDMIRPLSAVDNEARHMGLLRLLANVQESTGGGAVPALSRWLADLVGNVAHTYHHRSRRDRMAEKINRVAEGGNLSELLMVLDDQTEKLADQQGFNQARGEYEHLETTISEMDLNEEDRLGDARTMGEQIAAAIAGVLLCIVTAFVVLAAFGSK